jgi:hypothetical protein
MAFSQRRSFSMEAFQVHQFAAIGFIGLVAGMLGLFFVSFPALAVISAVQLSQRRQRNQRDRWARQRTLERAVQHVGIAASAGDEDVPPVSDYPDPDEDEDG